MGIRPTDQLLHCSYSYSGEIDRYTYRQMFRNRFTIRQNYRQQINRLDKQIDSYLLNEQLDLEINKRTLIENVLMKNRELENDALLDYFYIFCLLKAVTPPEASWGQQRWKKK